MEEKNIREYARLMQELGLTGLEVRQDGSLRLEREGQPAPAPAAPQPAAAPEKAEAVKAEKPAKPAAPEKEETKTEDKK